VILHGDLARILGFCATAEAGAGKSPSQTKPEMTNARQPKLRGVKSRWLHGPATAFICSSALRPFELLYGQCEEENFAVKHPSWKPGAVVPRGFVPRGAGNTRISAAKAKRTSRVDAVCKSLRLLLKFLWCTR
jgi:hypothetical protein